MSDTQNFSKLVPGFDFLEGLVKNAGASMPGIGQWVAPTINPEELDKRIEELRTVQYWLEQNARMLGATIQALEVQRMTLSTLKTMNVQMDALRDSMMLNVPGLADAEPAATRAPAAPRPAAPPRPQAPVFTEAPAPQAAPRAEPESAAPAAAGAVDPLQWWGALTKQFGELASTALKEGAAAAARAPVGAAKSAPSAEAATQGARRAPAKKRGAASRNSPPRKSASRKSAARKTG
ncbi:MAG: hypothetical protein M9915_08990 [Rhizobacter sp.]|nr:hypothetical protein [Rhizobacter sp.]